MHHFRLHQHFSNVQVDNAKATDAKTITAKFSCALILGLLLLSSTACSLVERQNDQQRRHQQEKPTQVERERLEQTWGPGEYMAMLTGTFTSKDRNLFVSVPLLSYYVRKEDRRGTVLLGGLLSYDMVSTIEENGEAVARRLTSTAILGIAGHLDQRSLDGTGSYKKSHWLFPFYRYREINGKRVLYPFMIFPVLLEDRNSSAYYDTPPWAIAGSSQARDPRIRMPLDPAVPVERERPLEAKPDIEKVLPPSYRERGVESTLAENTSEPRRERSAEGGNRVGVRIQPASGDLSQEANAKKTSSRLNSNPRKLSNNRQIPSKPKATQRVITHTVRIGESLYGISKKYYGKGTHWKRIYSANRDQLKSQNQIQTGMRLKIPLNQ